MKIYGQSYFYEIVIICLASIEAFEEQLDLIKVALKDNDERLLKDLFIKSSLRREKLEK